MALYLSQKIFHHNKVCNLPVSYIHSRLSHHLNKLKSKWILKHLNIKSTIRPIPSTYYYSGDTNIQPYCSKNSKHTSIGRRQKIIIKDVFHEKHTKIKNTGLKIKNQGKIILNDIKETKLKMKEKMEEVIERENIWTVPNLLCMSRICMSPLLGSFILHGHYSYALGFVIVAGVTDVLDGWIARTYKNQSSKLGSFLDPMADKVLIATLFLSLTYVELIPMYLTGLIILRDSLLVGAGFYIRYESLPKPRTLSRYFDVTLATAQLDPTLISKINTLVQLTLTFTTLGVQVFDQTESAIPVLQCLWALTSITTISSAISYIYARKSSYRILHKHKCKNTRMK